MLKDDNLLALFDIAKSSGRACAFLAASSASYDTGSMDFCMDERD
ncbi:hypothetical protein ACNKHK_19315 [Shigella flexneri]